MMQQTVRELPPAQLPQKPGIRRQHMPQPVRRHLPESEMRRQPRHPIHSRIVTPSDIAINTRKKRTGTTHSASLARGPHLGHALIPSNRRQQPQGINRNPTNTGMHGKTRNNIPSSTHRTTQANPTIERSEHLVIPTVSLHSLRRLKQQGTKGKHLNPTISKRPADLSVSSHPPRLITPIEVHSANIKTTKNLDSRTNSNEQTTPKRRGQRQQAMVQPPPAGSTHAPLTTSSIIMNIQGKHRPTASNSSSKGRIIRQPQVPAKPHRNRTISSAHRHQPRTTPRTASTITVPIKNKATLYNH